MKKISKKIISIVLCFNFICCSICMVNPHCNAQALTPAFEKQKSKQIQSTFELGTSELKTAKLLKKDIPEIISQTQIENKGHVNRLFDLEDENSIVFQNKDGSETMYMFSNPIQYREENGTLTDKKRTLKASSKDNYSYEVTTSDVKSYFPENLSSNSEIIAEHKSNKITMTPLYSQETNSKQNEKTNTVKKELATQTKSKKIQKQKSCNSIDYEGLFGNGTNVRYTPTFTGFKEDIIINSPKCNNTYSFELNVGKLEATKKNNGITIFDPSTTKEIARISPVYIYDSSDNPNVSTNGYYKLVQKNRGKYIVMLVADEDFLNKRTTEYPVYLDPSLEFNTTPAIKDAIFYDGNYTIYDNWTEGCIGNSNSSYGVGRYLVSFRTLSNNTMFKAISSSAKITKANFSMYLYGNNDRTALRPYLYRYDWLLNPNYDSIESLNGWDAWEVHPDMFGDFVENHSVAKQYTFDITPAVKAWKSNSFEGFTPTTGLMFQNAVETNTSCAKHVYMRENTDYQPYLEITYIRTLTLDKKSITINSTNYQPDQDLFPTLSATLQPETDLNDLIFTSSNENVVRVSEPTSKWIGARIVNSTVYLNPVSNGTATVTVHSKKKPTWYRECVVTVKDAIKLGELSIFSCAVGEASSTNISGHSYIFFYNTSGKNLNIGKIDRPLSSNTGMTIGTWDSLSEHSGIWYNVEASTTPEVDGRVSLTFNITSQEQINAINEYIDIQDEWAYLDNCSTFACGLWNEIVDESLEVTAGSINTPSNLCESIKGIDGYETDKPIYENTYSGYFDSNSNTFVQVNF